MKARERGRAKLGKKENEMKYMLMMNTMKAGGEGFPGWAEKDLQAHIAFMLRIQRELTESGELVSAEGLTFPDQSKCGGC
jgi:hypothetical protein